MKDLIEALQFIWKFLKNPDTEWPTSCEHDDMYVCNVNLEAMTAEDVRKISKLGFDPGSDDDYCIVKEYLGEDFASGGDWDKVTDEQWDSVKCYLTDCVHSFRYGSC